MDCRNAFMGPIDWAETHLAAVAAGGEKRRKKPSRPSEIGGSQGTQRFMVGVQSGRWRNIADTMVNSQKKTRSVDKARL